MAVRNGFLWLIVGLTVACDNEDDDEPSSASEMPDGEDSGSSETGDGMTTMAEPEPECADDAGCPDGQMCSGGQCIDMYWVVGDDGAVIRVGADGSAEVHPELPADMAAIECVGTAEAWAVGTGGVLVQTIDAGRTWQVIATTTTADLRDVEGDHADMITAVGVDGTWIAAQDGASWRIEGAEGSLEGVAMGGAGMLAVGRDGGVWAAEPQAGVTLRIAQLESPTRAIDLAHDSTAGVIVGDGGALWWSSDGVGWSRQAVGTNADLYAVQIARDGHAAIAVGDDGTIVRVEGSSVRVVTIGEYALRDFHVDTNGAGAAVGLGGVVAATFDGGDSFVVQRVGKADLFGVDALGTLHW